MHSSSILSCIMTMISKFMIFFISQIFIFKFFFTSIIDFWIDSCCSFFDNFIFFFLKLITFIAYCRYWKAWWNMFTYFCCRWTFRIIFTSIKNLHFTLKTCINDEWCFIRILILIKCIIMRHNSLFFMVFHPIQVCFLF